MEPDTSTIIPIYLELSERFESAFDEVFINPTFSVEMAQ